MFKNLTQGSLIYVLYSENGNFDLKIGSVVNITNPQFFSQFQTFQDYLISIDIKIDDNVVTFNSVPANSPAKDIFGSNGRMAFLASSKEAMINKVNFIRKQSEDILSSTEKHQKIIADCDIFLQDLNPVSAKEIQQEKEIGELKEQVAVLMKRYDEALKMFIDNKKTTNKNQGNG